MVESIDIAVIGCGWAGRRHALAFEECGASVRWCIDLDLDRARALATSLKRAGQPPCVATCYHAALDDPEVDAVTICLPHSLHAATSVGAVTAGKHVLCEKPMAHSVAAADKMISAAEAAGVILMIAENVRFSPLYRRVRQLLQDGVIGQPALVRMARE